MTTAPNTWSPWRIARWSVAIALLLTPLLIMQLSDEWNWSVGDFVFAGIMICGTCLVYEAAARRSPDLAYRGGAILALAASFVIVWINLAVGIVGEDDPANVNFFGLVIMAAAASFAADFRAKGLARAMACVAVAQIAVGMLAASAPNTESSPGPVALMGINGGFAALWLLSAALFHRAARKA